MGSGSLKPGGESRPQSPWSPWSPWSWRPRTCSATESHARLFLASFPWGFLPTPFAPSPSLRPPIQGRVWGHLCLRRTGPWPGGSAPVPGFPPATSSAVSFPKQTRPCLLFFYCEVLLGDPPLVEKGRRQPKKRRHMHTHKLLAKHSGARPLGMQQNPLESQRAPMGRTSELPDTCRGGFT